MQAEVLQGNQISEPPCHFSEWLETELAGLYKMPTGLRELFEKAFT